MGYARDEFIRATGFVKAAEFAVVSRLNDIVYLMGQTEPRERPFLPLSRYTYSRARQSIFNTQPVDPRENKRVS